MATSFKRRAADAAAAAAAAQEAEDERLRQEQEKRDNELLEQAISEKAKLSAAVGVAAIPDADVESSSTLKTWAFLLPATFAVMLVMVYHLRSPAELGIVAALAAVAAMISGPSFSMVARRKYRQLSKSSEAVVDTAAAAVQYSTFVNAAAYAALFAFVYSYFLPGLAATVEAAAPLISYWAFNAAASLLLPAFALLLQAKGPVSVLV